MKKLLTIMLALLVSVCCFATVACTPATPEEVGSYELKSVTFNGITFSLGEDAPWGGALAADMFTLELKEDNTIVSVSKIGGLTATTQTGTWEKTETGINLNIVEGNETQTVSATYAAGDLTLNFDMQGQTLSYVLTKVVAE